MKEYTPEQFKAATTKAIAMREKGAKWAQILEATGLSHSQAEIAWFASRLTDADREQAKAIVAELGIDGACVRYRELGFSWGVAAIHLGISESEFRRRFKDASGKLSEGQRIGKGGRFLNADPELYRDVLKPTGTVIPKEVGRRGARAEAVGQRLVRLEMGELKSLAADYGITVPKGSTKAQLAKKLQKVMVNA